MGSRVNAVEASSSGDRVACSLGERDMADRLRHWQALGDDALIRKRIEDGVITATYEHSAEVLRRLQSLIEAEGRCCPFLRFELREEGDVLTLEVAFPPGAEPMMDLDSGRGGAS